MMKKIIADEQGQDLIEYALMAGFVVVAAGAIMPGISTNIKHLFKKVACFSGDPCVSVPSNQFDGDPLVRIVCAGLAAVILGVIVLRRRSEEEE